MSNSLTRFDIKCVIRIAMDTSLSDDYIMQGCPNLDKDYFLYVYKGYLDVNISFSTSISIYELAICIRSFLPVIEKYSYLKIPSYIVETVEMILCKWLSYPTLHPIFLGPIISDYDQLIKNGKEPTIINMNFAISMDKRLPFPCIPEEIVSEIIYSMHHNII